MFGQDILLNQKDPRRSYRIILQKTNQERTSFLIRGYSTNKLKKLKQLLPQDNQYFLKGITAGTPKTEKLGRPEIPTEAGQMIKKANTEYTICRHLIEYPKIRVIPLFSHERVKGGDFL